MNICDLPKEVHLQIASYLIDPCGYLQARALYALAYSNCYFYDILKQILPQHHPRDMLEKSLGPSYTKPGQINWYYVYWRKVPDLKYTRLQFAIEHFPEATCELLIDGETDINSRHYLHQACLLGKLKVVKHLLRRGVDVDGCPWVPFTFLMTDKCHPLLPDSELKIFQDGREAGKYQGVTPLGTALTSAYRNNQPVYAEIAQLLVNAGADIKHVHLGRGTPLHMACRAGLLEVVRDLVKRGVSIDSLDKPEGNTPLLVTLGQLKPNKVDKEAPALKDERGASYLEIAKFLITRGAKLNLKNDGGERAADVLPIEPHGLRPEQ